MPERIFIQIASYRDPELPKTIANALATADHPERLTFGICNQFNAGDTFDSLAEWESDDRFRIDSVRSEDSEGCCWARSRVQKLYRGEEYTLQIDAHHRFAEGWDSTLIDMLKRCDSPKPIITCYPPCYNVETEDRATDLWEMLPTFSNSIHVTRFQPVIRNDSGIKKHMCWAGGFMFTAGSFCTEVPYDPELYFQGEEISMAVRSWTRGYDFFLPDILCVWHQYVPRGRIRHWTDHTVKNKASLPFHILDKKSKTRVADLLLGRPIPEPYGLGTDRTLEEFENAAGICFEKSMVSMETRRRAAVPVFTDSTWKEAPNMRYTLRLNWTEKMPELIEQSPDVVAVFVRERRIDLPCKNGIPERVVLKESWQTPPENFTVWAYKKAPVCWGKQHRMKVVDYDEDEL